MTEPIYEIKVHGGWITVNYYIFRSWGGQRRVNGADYGGPVYLLGTDTVYREAK
jgi:hypothetical protein